MADLSVLKNIVRTGRVSHAVKIAPWFPSPGDYVLCLYIPTDDGDGFVIGGI